MVIILENTEHIVNHDYITSKGNWILLYSSWIIGWYRCNRPDYPPPPLDWTIPGYSLDYNTLGIVWELPDYTPVYTLGAPRVYPTSPDYTPPDSRWGIVWAIGVYSGIYHI